MSDEVEKVAIPVRKGDDTKTLLAAINDALAKLDESGELTALSEKYFGTVSRSWKIKSPKFTSKAPVHIPAQELLIRRVYCVESLFMNLQRKSVGICKKCHRFSGKLIGTDRLCHNSEAV